MYEKDRFPSLATLDALVSDLHVTQRQVKVWFQNKRQRELKPNGSGRVQADASVADGGGAMSLLRDSAHEWTSSVERTLLHMEADSVDPDQSDKAFPTPVVGTAPTHILQPQGADPLSSASPPGMFLPLPFYMLPQLNGGGCVSLAPRDSALPIFTSNDLPTVARTEGTACSMAGACGSFPATCATQGQEAFTRHLAQAKSVEGLALCVALNTASCMPLRAPGLSMHPQQQDTCAAYPAVDSGSPGGSPPLLEGATDDEIDQLLVIDAMKEMEVELVNEMKVGLLKHLQQQQQHLQQQQQQQQQQHLQQQHLEQQQQLQQQQHLQQHHLQQQQQ